VNPKSTQVLTDLCIAINAVEGASVAPEYEKQNERVRKTLYEFLIGTAMSLYMLDVSLKKMDKAIRAAGWEDQHFVESGVSLKIVNDE
jgi:hypothetical protein